MNDDGAVTHSIVLHVLTAHNVTISHQNYGHFEKHRLVKGDVVVTINIDDFFSRRVLQYLKRTFNVPIDHFYHPERAPVSPEETRH